jgi:hypothetical protein
MLLLKKFQAGGRVPVFRTSDPDEYAFRTAAYADSLHTHNAVNKYNNDILKLYKKELKGGARHYHHKYFGLNPFTNYGFDSYEKAKNVTDRFNSKGADMLDKMYDAPLYDKITAKRKYNLFYHHPSEKVSRDGYNNAIAKVFHTFNFPPPQQKILFVPPPKPPLPPLPPPDKKLDKKPAVKPPAESSLDDIFGTELLKMVRDTPASTPETEKVLPLPPQTAGLLLKPGASVPVATSPTAPEIYMDNTPDSTRNKRIDSTYTAWEKQKLFNLLLPRFNKINRWGHAGILKNSWKKVPISVPVPVQRPQVSIIKEEDNDD